MAKIYKLVVAKGPQHRWLQVPENERETMWEDVKKAFKDVGGEAVMWADSSWSSEEYPGFFVESYPSVEALQEFTAYLNKIDWLKYFDVLTVVGTEGPPG